MSGHVIPDATLNPDAVPDEHHRRRAERLLGNKLLADIGSACRACDRYSMPRARMHASMNLGAVWMAEVLCVKTCIHVCIAVRLGSAWWREIACQYMGDDVGPTVAELLAALDEGGGVQGDDKWKRLGGFTPPSTHMARTFARSSRAC